MRIRIEEEVYEGTPLEIMSELWEGTFDQQQFPDLGDYIRHVRETFIRVTDLPCAEKEDLGEQAEAILQALEKIDMLEILPERQKESS